MHLQNNAWIAEYDFWAASMGVIGEIQAGQRPQSGRPRRAVADITISGLLLPKVPAWGGVDIREYGIDATGYDEIEAAVDRAMLSTADTINIAINSGGGAVQGIDRALDALRKLAETKTVVVHVETMAASAAYWLASTATEIRANRLAEIGGIGAYVVLNGKAPSAVVVIRSGEHKGAGIDGYTDEQLQAVQQRVDDIAAEFVRDVLSARKSASAAQIATGRTFGAHQAAVLGLVDVISNPSATDAAATPDAAIAAQHEENQIMLEEVRAEFAAFREELATALKREPETAEPAAAAPEAAPVAAEPAPAIEAASPVEDSALVAELRALRVALAKSGATPVENTGGADEAKAVEPTTWAEAIAYVQQRDKINAIDAGKKVWREFAHLHPANMRNR